MTLGQPEAPEQKVIPAPPGQLELLDPPVQSELPEPLGLLVRKVLRERLARLELPGPLGRTDQRVRRA